MLSQNISNRGPRPFPLSCSDFDDDQVRQPSESTLKGSPSNARSPFTPSTSFEESSSRRRNPRGRTASVSSTTSNSRSDPGVIYELAVDLQNHKQFAAAKRAFKNLARSYVDTRLPPHQDQIRELWKYKDVLDLETVLTWRNEVGLRRGVLYEDGKIEFEEWPIPPYENVIEIFENNFKMQFVFPWMNLNNLIPTFEGIHNQDTNFPGNKKQPDSAFIPNPRPNPNNLLANIIQLQPILGEPWPTIVLEVGNSEPVSKLIENRDKFLGHTTQVNVFVGISYNRNASRQTDSWWMCVAHRDIHAPQPPPSMVPEYPAPIIVGELHKTAGNGYPNVNLPIPPNISTWSVPTHLLFHPEPVPVMNPPLPPSLDINIELFRQTIVRKRQPWYLPFIILNLNFFRN